MSELSKKYFVGQRHPYVDLLVDDGSAPVNASTFPQEFYEIIALFSEDCNFNLKKIYTSFDRLFIEGCSSGKNTSSNKLMLRFGNRQLIVANIQFIHKRQGKMTALYGILKRIRRKYKLEPIMIECVGTPEIINWCEKNNFVFIEKENSYIEKMTYPKYRSQFVTEEEFKQAFGKLSYKEVTAMVGASCAPAHVKAAMISTWRSLKKDLKDRDYR